MKPLLVGHSHNHLLLIASTARTALPSERFHLTGSRPFAEPAMGS